MDTQSEMELADLTYGKRKRKRLMRTSSPVTTVLASNAWGPDVYAKRQSESTFGCTNAILSLRNLSWLVSYLPPFLSLKLTCCFQGCALLFKEATKSQLRVSANDVGKASATCSHTSSGCVACNTLKVHHYKHNVVDMTPTGLNSFAPTSTTFHRHFLFQSWQKI